MNAVTTYTQNIVRGKYMGRAVSKRLGIAQDQFTSSLDVYTDSLIEADTITKYMEGKHYTQQQLAELASMRRVPEKYNLLLRTKRLLVGYFSQVVTTAIAKAVNPNDTVTALLHNEMFSYTKRISNWKSVLNRLVDDVLTTGLCVPSISVIPTGEQDKLGREIYDVKIVRKKPKRFLLDYRSEEPDYSDAKFIHEWGWYSFDDCVELYGRDKVSVMQSDANYTDIPYSGDGRQYNDMNNFAYWQDGESFLVIHTYTKDKDGNISVLHWYGDLELKYEKLDAQTFPQIPIQLLREDDNNRYYSIYRDLVASQDSINQALLQFQLLINSNRVFVDNKAISDDKVDDFAKKYKMVNEVLKVKNIAGVKVEKLSADAKLQIEKLYHSTRYILDTIGINEAFLGMSKAGDSGRKFEGQRSASEAALNYIYIGIDLMHEQLLKKTIHYTSVYKQAMQSLRFIDDFNKERWVTINKPFLMPTGNFNPDGSLEVEPVAEEVKNPNTGRYEKRYINENAMSLRDIAIECEVYTAPYDDTDELERIHLESMLNSITGQLLANSNPGSVLYIQSLLTKHMKTRNSERIAKLLELVAQQLGSLPVEDPRLYINGGMKGGSMSGEGISNTGSNTGALLNAKGATNDLQPDGYNLGGQDE